MNKKLFWIFGTVQSASLAAIVLLVLRSLNEVSESVSIGLDTRIVLSICFPVFFLLTEYVIAAGLDGRVK